MANKGQELKNYTKEIKEIVVGKFLEGGTTIGQLSKGYGVPKGIIKTWIYKFKHKDPIFEDTQTNKRGRTKKEEGEIDYKERYEILKKYQAFLKAQREKK
jgi:transposase-like protein